MANKHLKRLNKVLRDRDKLKKQLIAHFAFAGRLTNGQVDSIARQAIKEPLGDKKIKIDKNCKLTVTTNATKP